MINLWYDSDEVAGFHPIVETAINNAITNCGYDTLLELEHHPPIPNSTIVPDFAIKLKSNNRYIFVIEVKKTARDVTSQRFQNQSRNYVTDLATNWAPNYPKYFCLTNIEELILFADRQGPISTCILKGNPKSHTRFKPQTRDATQTSIEFQATFEQLLPIIYNRTQPDWENNWQPIIDTFYQNYQSVSDSLSHNRELSDEISLYEFFRLLAFTYLKDYYNQTNNPNQKYFRSFPSQNDNLQAFINRLSNNYSRVLQLDFNQVFSNHPNSTDRIFPENFNAVIIQYFKNTIQALNSYGSQAVSDNPLPEYIFNLLTSKVYDKETLHKKGKIMSDTELSILLSTLTIDNPSSSVIDPCSGDGALLDAAYDYLNILNLTNGNILSHNQLLNQINGIEIDPFLAQLATFRLVSKNLSGVDSSTNANIITGSTFENPNNNGYDVILMNPPFLRNDNKVAPITSTEKAIMNTAITNTGLNNYFSSASQPNLYNYFVNYAWHYLNYQGKAGFILMAKFLNNEEGEYLKQFILDKVVTIILYPRDYFEDFKVTTAIVILSKMPSNEIKFLRIKDSSLLSNPNNIKSILSNTSTTTIRSDYTLKITNRNIKPNSLWRSHLCDPEDKFKKIDDLSFLNPLSSYFGTFKRGGAENSGGSSIIYPNFNNNPYSQLLPSNIGFGIKNGRKRRNYILSQNDLLLEQAIHFPTNYDDSSNNGLSVNHKADTALDCIFTNNNSSSKWKKIVNSAYNSKVSFDILIPRAERTKHIVYFSPSQSEVVLTTNFFYVSGFQNGKSSISNSEQIKFITAFLNSSFGQIQFEINSNFQEGLRKIEKFNIEQFKVPNLNQMTDAEINTVNTAFDLFNNQDLAISGDEGITTPRRQLDIEVANIIFNRDSLGFQNVNQLTDFFELFLADLVEDRRL